ncbi:MAG: hypothetical protein M3O71_10570 [Bacteroidota bacterium]|nr:hypothetical protein [Bacteroidota bacterium]
MKQVEIFKTNVCNINQASRVIQLLSDQFPQYKANFDLDDCDQILRIETAADEINNSKIKQVLTNAGCSCQELPD